jgi:hypothetical protein
MSKMTTILSGQNFFMDDEARAYVDGEDQEVDDVKVVTVFGERKLKRLFVIVETYGHKKYGRGKREWLEQFTPAERKLVSSWYLKIYAWYLRTGIPRQGVQMSLSTYATLCKAADFFASI